MIEASIAKAIAEEVGRLVRELQPAGHPDDLVAVPPVQFCPGYRPGCHESRGNSDERWLRLQDSNLGI